MNTASKGLFYAYIQIIKLLERGVKLAIQFVIGFTSYTAIMSSSTSTYWWVLYFSSHPPPPPVAAAFTFTNLIYITNNTLITNSTHHFSDQNSLYSDTFLSVTAKVLFIVTAPPILHVVLNSLIYGGKKEIRRVLREKWGYNVELATDASRDSFYERGELRASCKD